MGPGTELEASSASGQQDWQPGEYAERNLARLVEAADGAEVRAGSYHRRVLEWLARSEPQVVEVIAAMIERAGNGPETPQLTRSLSRALKSRSHRMRRIVAWSLPATSRMSCRSRQPTPGVELPTM